MPGLSQAAGSALRAPLQERVALHTCARQLPPHLGQRLVLDLPHALARQSEPHAQALPASPDRGRAGRSGLRALRVRARSTPGSIGRAVFSTSCVCVTPVGSPPSSSDATVSASVKLSSPRSPPASSERGASASAIRSATSCTSRPRSAATSSTRTPSGRRAMNSGSPSSARRARITCCSSRTTCTGRRIARACIIAARSMDCRIHQVA